MNNILKIDGFEMNSLGVHTYSLISPLPNSREERVEIWGKNGTVLVNKEWEDRIVDINCYVRVDKWNEINEKMREVVSYLKINQDVLINFFRDENIFYYGRLKEVKDYEQNTPFSSNFTLSFICESECYLLLNETIIISTIEDFDNLTEGVDYVRDVNPYI